MQLLNQRRVSSLALAVATYSLLCAFPRGAAARETFPEVLSEKLGLEGCTPSCLPCHTEVPGTRENMREDGLRVAINLNNPQVGDAAEFAAVLDSMLNGTAKALPGDSDGDGKNDLAEIAAGDNPYGGTPLCGPKYGCGGSSVAPSAPTRLGAFAFALAFTAALLRRKRRVA
jgi:hypothetical protein